LAPDGKLQGGRRRKTVGEIESFVTMLLVHAWVNDLLIAGAPSDFIQAIACLGDDRIAERAYEAIFECKH
jgi:hypothetical protein